MKSPPVAHTPEFRRQIVGLVRSGRPPEELAREFGVPVSTIRGWVAQFDLDEGKRRDGWTTAELDELVRLFRVNGRSSPTRAGPDHPVAGRPGTRPPGTDSGETSSG